MTVGTLVHSEIWNNLEKFDYEGQIRPKKAARFLVYNLIQDLIGLTDQGERVLFDKKIKEWLFNEFCKSSFLLSNLYKNNQPTLEYIVESIV